MATYAFKNVQAALSGPGGAISLGNGAGASEEGITVSMKEEKNDMKVGADGTIMHSLRSSDAGRMTVRLLKTSPTNAALNALYNAQKQSSALWGQNNIVVADPVRGDVSTGTEMAFVKQPDIVYSKDGNMMEWTFEGKVEELLGTGTPVAA